MTARDVYTEATRRGLRLEPAGDRLAVIPKGKCPPDFAEVIRAHKGELLALLNSPPCPGWRSVPSAGLPLNPNPYPPQLSGSEARRIMSYVVRQLSGTDPLCEWCVKRELAYWLAYHWPDADCALAAALDAACFQLKRSPADTLTTLAAFDEVERG